MPVSHIAAARMNFFARVTLTLSLAYTLSESVSAIGRGRAFTSIPDPKWAIAQVEYGNRMRDEVSPLHSHDTDYFDGQRYLSQPWLQNQHLTRMTSDHSMKDSKYEDFHSKQASGSSEDNDNHWKPFSDSRDPTLDGGFSYINWDSLMKIPQHATENELKAFANPVVLGGIKAVLKIISAFYNRWPQMQRLEISPNNLNIFKTIAQQIDPIKKTSALNPKAKKYYDTYIKVLATIADEFCKANSCGNYDI